MMTSPEAVGGEIKKHKSASKVCPIARVIADPKWAGLVSLDILNQACTELALAV
jgi:hypothetical protein